MNNDVLLTILIVLPFVGSVLAATFRPNARNSEAWLAGGVALVCLILPAVAFPAIVERGAIRSDVEWIPTLGLSFSLRLDGFAWMFAMLVTGIGFLVVLYARYYMSPSDPVPRFFSFLLAFMGSMLLFPSYFLQVRGEGTLKTGLLLAPQGLGAMLTMPIGGRLTDKMGPGKLVLGGIVIIAGAMAVFTQIGADTSYVLLLGALFVMGMGMGLTMMPIMSAALASLTNQQVARGSTMMNIIQQVAGSIGTATMSVILTNQILDSPQATAYNGVIRGQIAADQVPGDVITAGRSALAGAFGNTYLVALVLIVACLVPALFLPRRKVERTAEQQEEQAILAAVH